jgi:uncharacterized LabA/DUF88 family protein
MEKLETEILEKKSQIDDEVQMFTESFSDAMGDFVDKMSGKHVYQNVAIFIDYDNVYWTLMKHFQHDPDQADLNKNLFIKLWDQYGRDNIRSFKAFADFESIRTQLTSLQKKRVQIRHVYSKGVEDQNKKNSSDIELCLDVIESTYKDEKISCYVIVTADSDMIPLLSRLMYKGKRVELYYLSSAISNYADITRYAHKSIDLLNFLEVEQQTYNLEDYIEQALVFIQDWWNNHGENEYKWLGQSWLKTSLAKGLSLPEIHVSELIEKLEVDGLIEAVNKQTNKGVKSSISITKKALEYITQKEAAPSQESN